MAAPLIDLLSSNEDELWPRKMWPPMRFDRPLSIGADGGHGPIRYYVSAYQPGRLVRFNFTAPKGFNGSHAYALEKINDHSCRLTHKLEIDLDGWTLVTWPLIFKPLHDALIEDSLFLAERFSGVKTAQPVPWSPWVQRLRGMIRKWLSLTTKPRAT